MRTIAQNFKKHPHTANFLMTFHAAAQGLPSETDESRAAEIGGEAVMIDLLNTVPVEHTFRPSAAQEKLMVELILELAGLDLETWSKATDYTSGMNRHNAWTRENTKRWITNLIAKVRELKAAAPKVAPPATGGEVEIPANYYGITHEGEVKCYQVDYGKEGTRWEGFLFLSRVSSDDRFPIRNAGEKARILAAIREDVEASQILAGRTMSRCRRCGRGLSDTKNPYLAVALGPECGDK